jgi:hypothetical protein
MGLRLALMIMRTAGIRLLVLLRLLSVRASMRPVMRPAMLVSIATRVMGCAAGIVVRLVAAVLGRPPIVAAPIVAVPIPATTPA